MTRLTNERQERHRHSRVMAVVREPERAMGYGRQWQQEVDVHTLDQVYIRGNYAYEFGVCICIDLQRI